MIEKFLSRRFWNVSTVEAIDEEVATDDRITDEATYMVFLEERYKTRGKLLF